MANEQEQDRKPRTTDEGGPIPKVGAEGGISATGPTSTTDQEQPSALGGDVATRSGASRGDRDETCGS